MGHEWDRIGTLASQTVMLANTTRVTFLILVETETITLGTESSFDLGEKVGILDGRGLRKACDFSLNSPCILSHGMVVWWSCLKNGNFHHRISNYGPFLPSLVLFPHIS